MKNLLILAAATIIAGQAAADTPPPPPDAAAPPAYETVCAPVNLTIYFGGHSTEVSPHAQSALHTAIDSAEGCSVTAIRATTISDDVAADRSELLQISEERTENVLEAIASAGVWPGSVQTDIVLARSTNRPDSAIEPIARRVEIELQTVRPITS